MGNCEVNSTLSPSLLCNEEECLLLLLSQEKRIVTIGKRVNVGESLPLLT